MRTAVAFVTSPHSRRTKKSPNDQSRARPSAHRSSSRTTRLVNWLLEESQPSVRFRTMTELLGRSPAEPEVRAARAKIATAGWAADILAQQRPSGCWASDATLYTPKYASTNWMLLVLSDLRLTREDPRVARGCEVWIERMSKPDGGFGIDGSKSSHYCTLGNMARALVRFGYIDHPQVASAFDWLVAHQAKLGGWSCWGSGRNLDSWEGLSAFAALPRSRWRTDMTRTVERAAEFFLGRELYKQGDFYAPWFRFHYPAHYYYDLLVGLDCLTALGYADDPRLGFALDHLRKRRNPDGSWNLDAVHPDVEGKIAEWFDAHPRHRPIPLALETVGQPSKMVTLTALKVLQRVGEPGLRPTELLRDAVAPER